MHENRSTGHDMKERTVKCHALHCKGQNDPHTHTHDSFFFFLSFFLGGGGVAKEVNIDWAVHSVSASERQATFDELT